MPGAGAARHRRPRTDLPLRRADVEGIRVFQAPFVGACVPLGYAYRVPPMEVAGTRLLLAMTADTAPCQGAAGISVAIPGYVSLVNVRGAVGDPEVGDPSVSWWGATEDSMPSAVVGSSSPAVAAMWSSSAAA